MDERALKMENLSSGISYISLESTPTEMIRWEREVDDLPVPLL